MSDSMESLRRKIDSATDLQSVVRTMKAMAASSIGQYEDAVRSLDGYDRTVRLGLSACFRDAAAVPAESAPPREKSVVGAVVFGSDQGLVGQFNEAIAGHVSNTLHSMKGTKVVWAVGERLHTRLADAGWVVHGHFALPNSIQAITPLVGQILLELEALRQNGSLDEVYLFHNRPHSATAYTPVSQRLLPLDGAWQRDLAAIAWPSGNLPQVFDRREETLSACVREYFFVSLFRACAESLASENASRLAAMQRAEENIESLLEELNRNYHRQRQGSIDEELFDLVSGFEALTQEPAFPDRIKQQKGAAR
jgi:F-type H+-transporting ATPase subunit gamma